MLRAAVRAGLLVGVALAGFVAWTDLTVRAGFEGKRWAVPARIYARPLELYAGRALSADAFADELRAAGYHDVARIERPASYRRQGDRFDVLTRSFDFWDGREPERRLSVAFAGGRLVSLSGQGGAVPIARLDPALIGQIHPTHSEDRVLVRLEDVPRELVAALIAVEDRDFATHHGVSLRAVGRAVWANLRAGRPVQGGSTLTQQLAKNFFLTPERSWRRKLHEAVIALVLEARYSKREILETYLNEVFLGQQGRRAVHGFGLAARHYFVRRLDELELHEVALLVALVKGPSHYNPRRHPERALERRNLVLRLMREQGLIDAAREHDARARPLGVAARAPRSVTAYPAFVDLVRRQLARDYRPDDLRSEGLRIFTTLDPAVQRAAEEALVRRLRGKDGTLEGAVVATAPASGEVQAVVGARSPRALGFNRALDALRPIGSLVKPAVYLTALERPERYTLLSPIVDAPVSIPGRRGETWTPKNYDGRAHGEVPLYQALAHSHNLATVRLGMDLGLEAVADTLKRLGVGRPIEPYPSMLLGAVELSVLDVAQMYQTIAAGGYRIPLRAIRQVTDRSGEPLARYGVSVVEAFQPGPAYLTAEAMRAVMVEGTGRRAYELLAPRVSAAGKTGTTDDLRDSWFAGFTGDRLAVVWVGRDDNGPTGLTGSTGALPVWAGLMARLPNAPLPDQAPAGVAWYWARTGEGIATDPECPGAVPIPFIDGSVPPYVPCTARAGGPAPAS